MVETACPFICYVDVFGSEPYSGNPLAVIVGTDGLSGEQMQRIAWWLNLSETTFLLPPTDPAADYRVRIFTREQELPFAGHPTLGSCHAWLEAQGMAAGDRTVTQQCGVGLVDIQVRCGQLSFKAPPLLRSGKPSQQELSAALRFLKLDQAAVQDAAWVDNGPGWLGIRLSSRQAVLDVSPDTGYAGPVSIGLVGPCPSGAETAFEVRAFYKAEGGVLIEDPVTGSLNASIAQWLFESGVTTQDYTAAQGTAIGCTGRISITRDPQQQVWVGGKTLTCFQGPFKVSPDSRQGPGA